MIYYKSSTILAFISTTASKFSPKICAYLMVLDMSEVLQNRRAMPTPHPFLLTMRIFKWANFTDFTKKKHIFFLPAPPFFSTIQREAFSEQFSPITLRKYPEFVLKTTSKILRHSLNDIISSIKASEYWQTTEYAFFKTKKKK